MLDRADGAAPSRVPWTGRDIGAAIALVIAVVLTVEYAAVIASYIADDEPASKVSVLALTCAILLASAFAIGAASGIRPKALVIVIAYAGSLTVAAEIAADALGPDERFVGISRALVLTLQSAVVSSLFLATAWLFGRVKRGATLATLGFINPGGVVPYAYALGAWGLAVLAIIGWGALTEGIEWLQPPDNTSEALELAGGNLLIALPIVGLFVPLAEETFFRGFILAGLRNRMRAPVALVVSAAIFAVFHVEPGLYVPIFMLGLALGWVYLRTGSVWPGILIHAVQNSLALIEKWQSFGS
jgi:membrane protease YdiL (CAAX protease family)